MCVFVCSLPSGPAQRFRRCLLDNSAPRGRRSPFPRKMCLLQRFALCVRRPVSTHAVCCTSSLSHSPFVTLTAASRGECKGARSAGSNQQLSCLPVVKETQTVLSQIITPSLFPSSLALRGARRKSRAGWGARHQTEQASQTAAAAAAEARAPRAVDRIKVLVALLVACTTHPPTRAAQETNTKTRAKKTQGAHQKQDQKNNTRSTSLSLNTHHRIKNSGGCRRQGRGGPRTLQKAKSATPLVQNKTTLKPRKTSPPRILHNRPRRRRLQNNSSARARERPSLSLSLLKLSLSLYTATGAPFLSAAAAAAMRSSWLHGSSE